MTTDTSGQGSGSPIPAELKRWNWGAFFLGPIWGIGNRVYIALLAAVPFVGLIVAFVLGAKPRMRLSWSHTPKGETTAK